ncbi:PepSY-associated TM helix domain-containing protein [Bacillus kexueae]|uniref:PepSY-associated TM helix domain-containing protein n=1 Tax=Aeribacillus kexueae TaxID=2078952 RepID=UPI001FAFC83A|nr:PepSY domain-containing protein [Bacillus kexueae]
MQELNKSRNTALYQTMWRWHFYAGIIFAPFLIILAISGAIYLFKPQIEGVLYKDLYEVKEIGEEKLAYDLQIEKVKEVYSNGVITSIKTYDSPERTTQVGVLVEGKMNYVFINPYTGEINGTLSKEEQFMNTIVKLHSELVVGGTFANRIVELAACWAVILLLTGLFIWWPRKKKDVWGTLLPRLHKRGRTFWRDLHAVPAFWLSGMILILILTGLPWTGVMGEQINRLATETNSGYPKYAFSFGEKPESSLKTKDVAEDVPWAAENLPVPISTQLGNQPISIDDVAHIAEQQTIQKPYTISMPEGEKGVYTISTSHTVPGHNATLHIDQYSGAVLSDVRFQDYGWMAKIITLGIAFHEGRLFGMLNQILGLIACMGLIVISYSSFVMWKKRKPKGSLGIPKKAGNRNIERGVFVIMLLLGVLMPLVGISIIVVYVIDRLVLNRIKIFRAI